MKAIVACVMQCKIGYDACVYVLCRDVVMMMMMMMMMMMPMPLIRLMSDIDDNTDDGDDDAF